MEGQQPWQEGEQRNPTGERVRRHVLRYRASYHPCPSLLFSLSFSHVRAVHGMASILSLVTGLLSKVAIYLYLSVTTAPGPSLLPIRSASVRISR